MRKSAILSLMVLGITTSLVRAEDPVQFADPVLKAAVEANLHLTNPKPSDMLGVTVLDINNKGITSLGGLEYATNLVRLYAQGNEISSISALTGLTRLVQVDLWRNHVGDISPLAGLTDMTDLSLGDNPFADLSPLAGLTKLTGLYLENNQLRGISALAGLVNLESLRANSCGLADISALAGMTELTVLLLDGNRIESVSPLSGLSKLETLCLARNSISDVSPLTGLINLQYLVISLNPLNEQAYCRDLHVIRANNESAYLEYNFVNPHAPTGVSASDRAFFDRIHISWNAKCHGPSGEPYTDYYQVYRWESSAANDWEAAVAVSPWITETAFDDTTASPKVDYVYRVRTSLDSSGSSGLSNHSEPDTGSLKVPPETLTISSTEGGSVATPGEGTFVCEYGSTLPVAASVEEGYRFVAWTGTAVEARKVASPVSPNTTIMVDGTYTLVAWFELIEASGPRTLVTHATQGGRVLTPGEGVYRHERGTQVSVTAQPDEGYVFGGWTGAAVDAGRVADPGASSTTVTIDDNYDLCASFFAAGRISVVVRAPNGGEDLTGGQKAPIKWQIINCSGNVEIEWSSDGGSTWKPVAQTSGSAGSYDWTVPTVSSDLCLIRVSVAGSPSICDASDAPFRIHLDSSDRPWYVDAAATGNGDGSSWADAFVSLQDALGRAVAGNRLWVAEGLYWPDLGAGCKAGDRAATFQLKSRVAIYGGFPAGGGTWQQRDPFVHKTILTGDIGRIGVATDNSYHVVTSSYGDATVVLDGFVVTGGYAYGRSPEDRGGGMYIYMGSPVVRNCTFVGNAAAFSGGGAFSASGVPQFVNCVFSGNVCDRCGGAISGDAALVNCTLWANSARSWGGGVAGGIVTAANCIFWANLRSYGTIVDAAGQFSGDATSTATYCCILGWSGTPKGEGNTRKEPLFVDADGPDNIAGTPDDDLRLVDGSPGIDAGSAAAVPTGLTTDLQGSPRIAGAAVDMGAFEFEDADQN